MTTKFSDDSDNTLAPGVDFGLKVASPIGNLVGQIFFGWLADLVGRKRMCECQRSICLPKTDMAPWAPADGVELMIIITTTFGQAMAGSGPAVNIVGVLTCLRFIMGIGIGGDYPLSAVIASEFAATRSRGRLMTAVFASQGWGYLGEKASHRILNEYHLPLSASTVVAITTVSIFKKGIIEDPMTDLVHLDYCWRILIGAGCIPGVIALYFRLTIPETPRFTMDIERNVKQACRNIEAVLSANGVTPGVWRVDREASTERTDAPRASISDFKRYFGQWKNARVLFGTAYSWFALDVRPGIAADG